VDDVVTTGATIEALARELLANNPELKISIISLAIAK
jgi:predicted amidophosphoribosyltransferase